MGIESASESRILLDVSASLPSVTSCAVIFSRSASGFRQASINFGKTVGIPSSCSVSVHFSFGARRHVSRSVRGIWQTCSVIVCELEVCDEADSCGEAVGASVE